MKKRRTKWWFVWDVPNGYFKVGEIFNAPPEKVRIKIKTDRIDNDFEMRKDEAEAAVYGLSKTLFEIGQKETK